jgi:hypothetical protein
MIKTTEQWLGIIEHVLHNMARRKNFYGENVDNFQLVEEQQIAIASGQALDRQAIDLNIN